MASAATDTILKDLAAGWAERDRLHGYKRKSRKRDEAAGFYITGALRLANNLHIYEPPDLTQTLQAFVRAVSDHGAKVLDEWAEEAVLDEMRP